VGTASWERPDHGRDEEQVTADAANSVLSSDPRPNDAIRSWLARGIHTFGIDPRRLGGRGHARRVLGEDSRLASGDAGGWRDLGSALERHTIHNGLTHLSPEEREVVNLAYLEGRSNPQIAATLGVSVSTVRRRLWLALDHLDEYVRRTGTWVSAILLLGLVYAIDRSTRLVRWASAVPSADWPHKLAAAVAVGTVTAAGVGLVVANQHSSTAKHSSPPATAGLIPTLPGVTKSSMANLRPITPSTAAPITPTTVASVTQIAAAPPKGATTATKATKPIKAGAGATNQQSGQVGSTSEQDGDADDTSPVVTVKSPSKRGSTADRSVRNHPRDITQEGRSDT
jgi:DNA-directed RNA polymerase specialized sigma24 family protein